MRGLHTAEASYLIRVPLADLEQRWADSGFIRIHRSYLVCMQFVTALKLGAAKPTVSVGNAVLPVSRRHVPVLREHLQATRVRPEPMSIESGPAGRRPWAGQGCCPAQAGTPRARRHQRVPGGGGTNGRGRGHGAFADPLPIAPGPGGLGRVHGRPDGVLGRWCCGCQRSRTGAFWASRCPGSSWALGVYPVIGTCAWLYVRAATKNENQYRDLVDEK